MSNSNETIVLFYSSVQPFQSKGGFAGKTYYQISNSFKTLYILLFDFKYFLGNCTNDTFVNAAADGCCMNIFKFFCEKILMFILKFLKINSGLSIKRLIW